MAMYRIYNDPMLASFIGSSVDITYVASLTVLILG